MAAPVHLSKLTSALRQLSQTEMEKLEAYLSSPYFDIPPGALPLFQYLRKFHPHYDEKKTDPTVIQKKAPALGNQKRQANYGSDLLKCVEHFLATEDFNTTPDSIDRHRLQAYKKHHMFEVFNKEHEQLLKALDEDVEQNFDTFYQRHVLTESAFNGFDSKLNRTNKNDIIPVTTTLDQFYALKKIHYHCELLNRHRVLGTAYNEENIEYLLQILEPFTNESYPYAYLFVNIYKMLKAKTFEEGEQYYPAVRLFIEQNDLSTVSVGIRAAISYITNYCQSWSNRGYKSAGAQALWAQELRIKYDLLLEHGKMQPSDYRNIVALAIINNKDADWIKKFIDTYSPRLPDEQKETNSAFALAQYFYYIKDFANSMPLFQQAQAKDEPIFNAIVRRWQFMCMYEQDPENTDLLFDFLSAYEKYVLRYSHELHWLKDTFVKNIFYSKKLLKATSAENKKELAGLLSAENYFAGKEWLTERL